MGGQPSTRWNEQVEWLYAKHHLSTREIATKLGISKTSVGMIVKRLGLSRSRRQASKPGTWHKPTSTHWRTTRARARKVWEQNYSGAIPPGYHVHHVDGDHTNNDISNLALLWASVHLSEHSRGPEYEVPRHARRERRKYMRSYLYYYARQDWVGLERFKARWRQGRR